MSDRQPICTLPGCIDGPVGRATRGRRDGRQPVTTGRQPECDEAQLRRVVAGLSDVDLEAWSRGDPDTRLPVGCSASRAAQAARAEQRRRQNNATAAQAAAAHERAGGGTEARQTVPDTLTLPVVGEIPTTHALAAGAGLALLASGTDGGAALAMPGGPKPDTVGHGSNGVPTVKSIDTEGDFFGVRFRQPGRFTKIRTPAWAADVADSISKGAKVRMGRTDAGNWFVQSVLIEKSPGKDAEKAEDLARRVVREIETDGESNSDGADTDDGDGVPSPRSGEDRQDFMSRCLSATDGNMGACAAAWES